MTPLKSHDDILSRYADGPALLESALADLSDRDLNLSLAPDSWSIRQIIHHLADGDDLWKTCVKAAIGNSAGEFTLQWYWEKPQLEWSESWKYASRNIESSLALLRANRQHIVELIQHTPDFWEKSIRLKRPDSESHVAVKWIIEMQAQHVFDHIKDIQAIRQAHGL